jgi:hypothetical protein
MNTRGRVVKGGAPFTVPEDDFLNVTFVPVRSDGEKAVTGYIADSNNANGTFRVIGPDLKGIPPGKYRVTVAHERKKKDLLKGAYDLARTPFEFDVDSSTSEIVLDLDKKK